MNWFWYKAAIGKHCTRIIKVTTDRAFYRLDYYTTSYLHHVVLFILLPTFLLVD